MPHFVYPFFCWWTVGLLLLLAMWITPVCTQVYKYLSESPLSVVLGMFLGVELLDHMLVLFTFEDLPNSRSQWLDHFPFPPAGNAQGSNFSTSSPILVIFHFFDNNHPHRCEVACEHSACSPVKCSRFLGPAPPWPWGLAFPCGRGTVIADQQPTSFLLLLPLSFRLWRAASPPSPARCPPPFAFGELDQKIIQTLGRTLIQFL